MKNRTYLLLFSLAFGYLNISPTWSQENAGKPELRVGVYSDGLKFDGRVDDPCWQLVDSIASLTMVEPDGGAKPTFPTVVKVVVS